MLCLVTTFSEWLQKELDDRTWTVSDLARAGGLYPATISNVLNGNRGIGRDVAEKIAKGLKLDTDLVLYKAGILKRDPHSPTEGLDPLALDILQILENRSEVEQQAALAALKALFERLDRGLDDRGSGSDLRPSAGPQKDRPGAS